jgi:anti-sigma B factor antagonist
MEGRRVAAETADGVIVTLPTKVDLTNSAAAGAGLFEAATDVGRVIIADMTGTTFCDSSGLRMLLAAHDHAATAGCALRVAVTPGTAVSRVITIVGIDRVLSVYSAVSEALMADDGTAAAGARQLADADITDA